MERIVLDEKYWIYLQRKFPDRPPAVLQSQTDEVLKYLYLVSLAPRAGLPLLVTGDLDDIWHHLIMETQAYARLCAALPSGKFLHHSSNDYPGEQTSESPEASIQWELLLYANYVHIFGPFTEQTVHHWPGTTRLMQAAKLSSLEGLNDYLVAIVQPLPAATTTPMC
ncbi:MAG: hypothetical protein JHC61_01285 [Burkholderiaceae bacterium]|mgnify:CR=1 FL=1|nr:hypothetical protein [Burkholderiaceae bacterium]